MDQPFKKPKMHAIESPAAAAAPALSERESSRRTRDGRTTPNAFSLVELAVVLAILGILVGATLATNSYLNSARRSTIINEGKLYLNAMQQFESKYTGAIAGDMGNASDYWTGAPNGNGNGVIYHGDYNWEEMFYVFRHLQLAGYISGNYTGTHGAGGVAHSVIGENVPTLSMDGVSLYFFSPTMDGYAVGNPTMYDGFYHNYFLAMGKLATNSVPFNGFLSPTAAQSIDAKFDDGAPNTGWLRTIANRPGCVDNSGTPRYVIGDTADQCMFFMTK